MNEVCIIESGFKIKWICNIHRLKGEALAPLGNNFQDYEIAKRKNLCPECHNIILDNKESVEEK